MPVYYKKEVHDQGMLAIWELTECASELSKLIPDAEKVLDGIRSEKRKKERLATQALLYELFGTNICLCHHPNGSPFLPNNIARISITHTRRFVAVLTHPFKRTGIDMERLERNFSAVEVKALSPREVVYLTPEGRSRQLAILWSAKEAIYKCVAQEGVEFGTQIEIDPFFPQECGTLSAHFYGKEGGEIKYILDYKNIDDHILVYMFAEK